ncbi:unnamed protein product, partial [Polarella glacialis]
LIQYLAGELSKQELQRLAKSRLAAAQPDIEDSFAFICAHAKRDDRCGTCGPALFHATAQLKREGRAPAIQVRKCSHVGGHKYAGNVIVFSGKGCSDDGHWYGYVTPESLADVLSGRSSRSLLWRGRLGVGEEDAVKERRVQVLKAPLVVMAAAVVGVVSYLIICLELKVAVRFRLALRPSVRFPAADAKHFSLRHCINMSMCYSVAHGSTSAGKSTQQVQLPGLEANDFRHPLDRRQTRVLESIPAISGVVRQVVAQLEQSIYQDNISSSILVGEKQYPSVHVMLQRACDILDIPKEQRPEVYIRQNPQPNAYTLAVQGKRPFIVVHTSLLDLCCPAEVEAVIAHELGHIKCEHGTWLSAANVLLVGASALPLPARVLGPVLERLQEDLGAWQRAAELSCDRASLLVAQDPWVALSVLVKLSGGSSMNSPSSKQVLPKEQLQAFLEQAKHYDESKSQQGPLQAILGGILGNGRARTHPMPVLRARELQRWADSGQFLEILSEKGVPLQDIFSSQEVPAA